MKTTSTELVQIDLEILPDYVKRFYFAPRTRMDRIRLPQGYELTVANEEDAKRARKWLKENGWIYEPRTHAYYPLGTFD